MFPIDNTQDIKTVAKNIKQALADMQYDPQRGLSQSAALNLASRALGYADYNTVKGILSGAQQDVRNKFLRLMSLHGIDTQEASTFIIWAEKYSPMDMMELYSQIFSEFDGEQENIVRYYQHVYIQLVDDALVLVSPRETDDFILQTLMIDSRIYQDMRSGKFATEYLSKMINVPLQDLTRGFETMFKRKLHLYSDKTAREFVSSADLPLAISLAIKSGGKGWMTADEVFEVMQAEGGEAEEAAYALKVTAQIEKGMTVEVAPVSIFHPLDDGRYQVQIHWLFERYVKANLIGQ